MRTLMITLTAVLTFASLALGSTYLVEPDGSGDYATIQLAVDDAVTGDVIELADGVFTGDGNRDIDFHGKAITVRSLNDDPELCVIDCEGSFAEPHRGFVFQFGENPDSVVRGITITHGSTLETCPGCEGGGIYCTNESSPTIENCTFRENVAASTGGGLYIDSGCAPTLTACRFIDNMVSPGTSRGGGLTCIGDFTGAVTDCEFRGNSAGSGGGMHFGHNDATFERCVFTGNQVTSEGGAVSSNFGSLTFAECVFTNNVSDFFGGALYFVFCDAPVLRNCTLYGNSGRFGAGIDVWESTLTIENTIIAFNHEGTAVYCEPGGEAILSCCDLFDNQDGDWVDCIADQALINGNLAIDPLFCDATAGDLSLDAQSVCLPGNNDCESLIGAFGHGCGPMSGVDDPDELPAAGQRLTIHPNPFNPATTIAFTLDRAAWARVAVHDLTGRRLNVLADRTFAAGSHTLVWHGRDAAGREVPSGTYVLRLKTDSGVEARKISLVR